MADTGERAGHDFESAITYVFLSPRFDFASEQNRSHDWRADIQADVSKLRRGSPPRRTARLLPQVPPRPRCLRAQFAGGVRFSLSWGE